jgi:FtsP/CotA-like multicopper oxidase with cupredoxin domain
MLLSALGCESHPLEDEASAARPAFAENSARLGRDARLTAAPGEVEIGPGRIYNTWLYNGQYPGPEIRVKEGERLRLTVQNDLPEAGTTVHWHGLPVPNPMDGVPGLTQEPIPSGGSMTYAFEARPAGTYMYHSHMNLQLDRGLVAPLIIEERRPHVDYDREHVLVLDDFLPEEPRMPHEFASSGDESGSMMGGMMNRDGGGRTSGRGCPMMQEGGGSMMGSEILPYEALLINGRGPEAPAGFEVKRGERVRLRLINLSSATTYHLAIAGHEMHVTHTEGRPVEPVAVDSLLLGMGERYDVILEANNSGAHTIMAKPIEGEVPEGLQGGQQLRYSDLTSVESPLVSGRPDRTFDLELSGGMMMQPEGVWTINGQAYPDAEPLEIKEGDHVRVNVLNHSMMIHPMHLHGHFFQTEGLIKDTVLVPPHMGRASLDFVADNPGDWFFHCHNLYHLHGGMARVFTYV